jgi:hypothetical protein
MGRPLLKTAPRRKKDCSTGFAFRNWLFLPPVFGLPTISEHGESPLGARARERCDGSPAKGELPTLPLNRLFSSP